MTDEFRGDEQFSGFEWDDDKSERCRGQRGFSFRDASRVFDGPYSQQRSGQERAEQRFETVGVVDGLTLFVVWTSRGCNRRIVSAWQASRKERHGYYQANERRD